MVAPIGNIANKVIFPAILSSSTTSLYPQAILPTVNDISNTGMDKSTGTDPVNNFEPRGRFTSIERNISRDSSMSSTCSSVAYHERVTMNNGMDIDIDPPTDFPALSYEEEQEKELCFRMATETTTNTRPQGGTNEASSCQVNHGDHMPNDRTRSQTHGDDDDNSINIQLLYDPNAPTEPDLWSGKIHPISLHGSIGQIASDAKNIKDSLNFMAKYITNKKINLKSANELKDLYGIGDAVWNFISSVYQSSWDSLYTDNKSKTLREKISAKFTPRIAPSPNSKNNKSVPKTVPASINKVPPPPPLPAKSAKEVNTISKYFQNQKPSNDKSKDGLKPARSYAQASKNNVSIAEVLKIKKMFPTLNVAKIDQVNNIVNGTSKLKPRIQTTTKGPSRKQVIIPMSKDNVDAFIKNSSLHVSNINRQFQNAKSKMLVDYI